MFTGNKNRQNTIYNYGIINNKLVNVTNDYVTRSRADAYKRPHRAKKSFGGKKRHPPKLFRYCASCGILDGDVVYGMSNGEMCDESVKVIKYASGELVDSIGRIGNDACEVAGNLCGFASNMYDASKCLCKSFSKLLGALDL